MTIKDRLIKAHILTAVGAALLTPGFSDAATLGRMTVQSGRNEPLRAEIQVMQIDPREATSLSARIGSRLAHEQARIPYADEAGKIEATIARKPDGGYVVQLRSREMITEPMLDVLVELKSPLSEVARPYLIDTSFESRAGGGADSLRGDSAARPESLLRTEAQVRGDPIPPRLDAPLPAAATAAPDDRTPAAAASATAAPATLPRVTAPPSAAASSAQAPIPPSARAPSAPTVPSAPATRGNTSSAAASSAESPSSVVVTKGDTLAAIAARTKADEVSLDRAMLAIFRANQQAFFGSIHQLKSDLTLRIPTRETMLADPDEFIARELRRHSEIFRTYKAQVAGAVPLASAQSTRPARDAAAAGTEKYDRLVLSKGASGLSNDEQRAAADVALREANSRISELQRNINDLKRLASLKDRQIAEASAQLKTLAVDRSSGGTAGVQPTSAQVGGSQAGSSMAAGSVAGGSQAAVATNSASPLPAPGVLPGSISPADAAKNELKASAALAASGAGTSSATAAAPVSASTDSGATNSPSATPAAPVVIKRVDPPAAVRTEADTSIPSYWIYGGVALVVLLVGFLVRRSRQRKAAQAALEEDPHSLFGDSAELDSRINPAPTTIGGKTNETRKPQVVPVN